MKASILIKVGPLRQERPLRPQKLEFRALRLKVFDLL